MNATKKRKQVRFADVKNPWKKPITLHQVNKWNAPVVLNNKSEECRFVTGALSRFIKPIEIPKNTHLIQHRPWNAGGIYTIRSVEPILPNTRLSLAVSVVVPHNHGVVQVYFSASGSLWDTLSFSPVQWLEIPHMKLIMNNGTEVTVQIEDSVHGQLLASFIKDLGLLDLQRYGSAAEQDQHKYGEGEYVEGLDDPMDLDMDEIG